ncbi:MAG: M20 metallopeptidase family protein [Gemmatimonadota bacterium]
MATLLLAGPGGLLAPGGARAQAASTPNPDAAVDEFTRAVEARRDELIAIRRDIHRHPEPSGEEERTASLVADVLRDAGFEVTTGLGGHGVVGMLRGRADGPVLAFRADMDAVRGPADDPMEFRSVVPDVHHVCGHDIHTTVGLALAFGFSAIRDRLPGTVMLIFQPEEETATGARAMLADGVFGAAGPASGPPDAVFAYHTAPLPVGQIMTRAGTLLPGRDRIRVTIRADDDLAPVAEAVRALGAGLATDGSDQPMRPAGEPFIAVRGLQAERNGPETRLVGAVLTSSGSEASQVARESLERGLAELRRPGLDLELDYQERWVAGTLNDATLVERSGAAARGILGEAAVREAQSTTTVFSEDYGSFQQEAPGVMYFLGVSNPERGWVGMPHTPTYVADEEAIFVGAEVMAAVFLDLLRRPE